MKKRKISKRKISILLATVMALSVLTGCGDTEQSQQSSESASKESAASADSSQETQDASDTDAEVTKINFYYSTDMENTVAPMVEAFNAAGFGVEVVPNSIPEDGYDDKIKVMTAGQSDEADVFWMRTPAKMAEYIENGALMDLKPYADASGVDLSPIKDTSLASVTDENGSFYGYPDYGTCWMLFYNKDLFDAKGLDYPGQMTWDEYLDLIAGLTEEENGTKYWGGLSPIWTPNLGAIPSGEYLDSDTLDKTREYAQIQHRMYVEDASAPGIAEMTSGTFDINSYFTAGNVYTMINGDWTFRNIDPDFEYGAAPLPVLSGVEEGTSAGQASYLAIPVSAKHPEAAYQFIEFYCTSPDGTSIIAEHGNVPAYATDVALAVYKEKVTAQGVENRFSARVMDEQKSTATYSAVIEAYSQELQLYLLDEQSLDELFEHFEQLRAEILDQ